MKQLAAIAGIALLASACVLDEDAAGPGDTLLVPADVELKWDDSWNAAEDGKVAVVPVDLMVYDGATGEPQGGVTLEVVAPADTFILTEGELVRVDPDECVDCVLLWDAFRDAYYVLEVELEDAGVVRLSTGPEGLARVYVLVDAVEPDGSGYAPVSVHVQTDSLDEAFSLLPQP